MRYVLPFLLAALALGACSRHHMPLDISKKQRLVLELIRDVPECQPYRDHFTNEKLDDDKVDDVFHEAMRSHCIKSDV